MNQNSFTEIVVNGNNQTEKLKPGDVIGIISPASSPDDLTKINSGVQYLEKLVTELKWVKMLVRMKDILPARCTTLN